MLCMKRFTAFLCLSVILVSCGFTGFQKEDGTSDGILDAGHRAAGGNNSDKCSGLHGDDLDHCYQEWAVEDGDVKICERINSGRFILEEIQPPRDKCLSMVAVKLCDPNVCDLIGENDEFFTAVKCMQAISRKCP